MGKKELLDWYRRFPDLSINETNNLKNYIQETQSPKIFYNFFFLTLFHIACSLDLSGYPGIEKICATITENHYFPNIQTMIAIITQDCVNWQTSKLMPNLLIDQQQLFLEVSPYFNHRISMNTKKAPSLHPLIETITYMLS